MGYYCGQSAITPIECPIGTFQNLSCKPEPFYEEPSGSGISGDSQNFIMDFESDEFVTIIENFPEIISGNSSCPYGLLGASTFTQCRSCWKGYYCPKFSLEPIKCAVGSYQQEIGKPNCKKCPPGNPNNG